MTEGSLLYQAIITACSFASSLYGLTSSDSLTQATNNLQAAAIDSSAVRSDFPSYFGRSVIAKMSFPDPCVRR